MIYVETDPLLDAPELASPGGTCRSARPRPSTSTQRARATYDQHKSRRSALPQPTACIAQLIHHQAAAGSSDTTRRADPRHPHRLPPPTPGASGSPTTPSRCRPTGSSPRSSTAGYEWIELGPVRLPADDPTELQDTLDEHNLLGARPARCSPRLHQPDSWDAVWKQVTDVAALTQAVGGEHIVVIPDLYRDHKTGEPTSRTARLTDEQWKAAHHRAPTSSAAGSWTSTACTCSSTRTPTATSATSPRSSASSRRRTPST